MKEVFVEQLPYADWQPAVGLQKSFVAPQNPLSEQQLPNDELRHV